jgi:hypothetical protein
MKDLSAQVKAVIRDAPKLSTFRRHPRLVVAEQILWVLITMLFPAVSSASTIIGMIDVRHDSMVLAADSKVRLDQVNGASSNENACKIVVGNDYAFALDGWVSSDLAKFDAAEIAKRAVDSTGDVFEKAAKVDDLIKEPFFHLAGCGKSSVSCEFVHCG